MATSHYLLAHFIIYYHLARPKAHVLTALFAIRIPRVKDDFEKITMAQFAFTKK
jgi:hypothetical protein